MAFALIQRSKPGTSTPAKPGYKSRLVRQSSLTRTVHQPPRIKPDTPATALATTHIIQAKLRVDETNDKFEQEADRVADEVIRMPESEVVGAAESKLPTENTSSTVKRMCEKCAEEEVDTIQTKRAIGTTPDVTSGIEAGIQSLRGGGQPLSIPERTFFEQRFGHDFSQVRVHTDGNAVEMSKELGAQAFTHGNDVYFNEGEFDPISTGGKHLLAHELTHTIQQGNQTIRRQGIPNCNQAAITAARESASMKVQTVKRKLSVNPGYGTVDQKEQTMRLARKLVSPKVKSVDGVAELMDRMLSALSSDSKIQCGPEIAGCAGWDAYVEDNQPPIHLCASFFEPGVDVDQQVQKLLHEAVHASGIGDPAQEQYLIKFDCNTGMDDLTSADAWAHFVYCATTP